MPYTGIQVSFQREPHFFINMHTQTETEDHFLQAAARPKQILQKVIEFVTVKLTLTSSIDFSLSMKADLNSDRQPFRGA